MSIQSPQQTGHATDSSARHHTTSRVSRLLSWVFDGATCRDPERYLPSEGGPVMEQQPWSRRQFLVAAGAAGLAVSDEELLRAATASHYAKVVLAKKPVAFWRLGEDKGPAALDSTGNGHTGAYKGAPVLQQKGAIQGDPDTAVQLDGKRSYVEAPGHKDFSQPTSGKGLTVEVWVRPDALEFEGETGDPHVHWLGKGEPRRYEWALRFYSRSSKGRPNRISAYLFNPQGGLGAGAYFQDRLTAGAWVHVVACFDPGGASTKGAGVHIYKNGVHRLGPPSPGALYNNPRWKIKPARGDAPLRLGTRDLKSFLTGAIDEAAVYPRVLTAKEVLENYNAGKGK